MRIFRCAGVVVTLLVLSGCGEKAPLPNPEPMGADDFRRELVDVLLLMSAHVRVECGEPVRHAPDHIANPGRS